MKILIVLCFAFVNIRASPIFDSPIEVIEDGTFSEFVPESFDPFFVPANDVRFLLFTRFNPTIGQEIRFNDMATVRASNWVATRPTRFLVHGFNSNAQADVNILVTAAYLRSYDLNIVVVDWSIGANTINYITARNQVNPVGSLIGLFLDNLHESSLTDFSRVACIGHSLGAHICGHAGKAVTHGRINTIIGLDPAGPLFDVNNPATRLANTDAEYVENIHTDTRSFGIGAAIGHVDFYPNGGFSQPGCLTQVCDHGRAVNFFAESVNSYDLWGRLCVNIDEMDRNVCTGAGASMGGEPSNHVNSLRGIHRMITNGASPFGRGQF